MIINQRGWIPSLIALVGTIAMMVFAFISSNAIGTNRLASARALWESSKPASYLYTVQISCFCPAEYTQPVQIQVQNGFYFDSVGSIAPVSENYLAQYGSVEELFGMIEAAYEQGADMVKVEYDPTYGVPLRVSIDYIKEAIDDEISLTVSDFKFISVEEE
jgi:hypothetical protein